MRYQQYMVAVLAALALCGALATTSVGEEDDWHRALPHFHAVDVLSGPVAVAGPAHVIKACSRDEASPGAVSPAPVAGSSDEAAAAAAVRTDEPAGADWPGHDGVVTWGVPEKRVNLPASVVSVLWRPLVVLNE